MPRRPFRPEDALRLKAASDPELSPDGRRVAFVVATADAEADRLASSLWVADVDQSSAPRSFTDGPLDRSPRWSPDGRWLAYISVTDDKPHHAHVRLAPLDGGAPHRLGDLPGPVLQLAWAPDSRQIVVVCRVGAPDRDNATATEANGPRVVTGLAARLDGVGWQEGRRHLFLVDVADGSAKKLTRGNFDHADPAFSPDGTAVVCASDRHPRRDDRQFRSDAWLIPVGGGRPRRLTSGKGRVAFPQFSPDGASVAYAGQVTDTWDDDAHIYVVPADGTGAPERIAPQTDRGVPVVAVAAGAPTPLRWTGAGELAMLLFDRGSVVLHRARVGDRRSREVVGGDIQIDGFAAQGRNRTAATVYTAAWPDRPSELYLSRAAGADPVPLTRFHEDLLGEVALSPVKRSVIGRPDGTQVEYFTIVPPRLASRRLPLHLDIHGGPHGSWPAGRFLGLHQAIAGAGYAVLLPNPRGSTGYGQEFTSACTGDWGGADFEDIMACCDDVIERGIADGDRMFVSGGSYGGFMTAWAVGHSRRFRAAAAMAAVIDQTSMAFTTDIPEFAVFNMGGTPWQRPDEYHKRSPLTYLENVSTPMLVIHWEGDIRVPVGQGEELYVALRVLGKEAEMVRYPGGFHIMRTPSQGVDWARRLIEWDERHDGRDRAPRRNRVTPAPSRAPR